MSSDEHENQDENRDGEVFSDLLCKYPVLLDKGQLPAVKEKKRDALMKVQQAFFAIKGKKLEEKQLLKKISNIKANLKKKQIERIRTGNRTKQLHSWEAKVLKIMCGGEQQTPASRPSQTPGCSSSFLSTSTSSTQVSHLVPGLWKSKYAKRMNVRPPCYQLSSQTPGYSPAVLPSTSSTLAPQLPGPLKTNHVRILPAMSFPPIYNQWPADLGLAAKREDPGDNLDSEQIRLELKKEKLALKREKLELRREEYLLARERLEIERERLAMDKQRIELEKQLLMMNTDLAQTAHSSSGYGNQTQPPSVHSQHSQ